MKHPTAVRDQLLTLIAGPKGALEHLRIRLSMYVADEVEVLRQLERPQAFDLGVDIVNYVMERLEKAPAPASERYFDKTHRAMNKKNPRRGRGVLTAEDKALLAGAAQEKGNVRKRRSNARGVETDAAAAQEETAREADATA